STSRQAASFRSRSTCAARGDLHHRMGVRTARLPVSRAKQANPHGCWLPRDCAQQTNRVIHTPGGYQLPVFAFSASFSFAVLTSSVGTSMVFFSVLTFGTVISASFFDTLTSGV